VFERDPLKDLSAAIAQDAASAAADFSICVHFETLQQQAITLNADRMQDTMSLIKVAILIALIRVAERGEVHLDERCTFHKEDRRLGTSLISLLDEGLNLSLRDAARLMIIVSDNAATDLCLRRAGGPAGVMKEMSDLGIEGVDIRGTALDWFRALVTSVNPEATAFSAADLYEKGYPPLDHLDYFEKRKAYHFNGGPPFSLASARGMVSMFRAIYQNRAASPQGCILMRKMLREQQMQTMLPRYAFGISCEHKTGNFFPFIASDAGIFTAPNGHVAIMAVMTQRYAGHREGLENVIAHIGARVFAFLQAQPAV